MSAEGVSIKPVVDEVKEESEPQLDAVHEVGEIIGSTENIQVDTLRGSVINQRMPKTDLGNFMQRPVRIATASIASTDAAFSQVSNIVPWESFFNNASIASKTKDFAFWRGTLHVQAITTVPAGAFGLYLVSACPYGDPPTTGTSIADPHALQATQLPHALVDLSRADDATFMLDWCFPMDYATFASLAKRQWRIFVHCLLPVSNGQAATALTGEISFYAWAGEDFEMVVPYPQGKKAIVDKVNEKVKSLTGGKKASEVASTISSVASKVGSYVPFLAPMAGTVATGAAAVSSALDWFGFTREAGEKEPTPVVARPFSNIANMDGVDTGEISALSVSNAISIDPRIGGGQALDESAFEEIFQHWTLIHIANWNTSDTIGTKIVTALPVTPTTAYDRPYDGAVLTTAGYVGLPFQYWRGDMEYKIVVPVSKFHRGAIQIAWLPNTPAAVDLTNTTLNTILEVDSECECTFDVGFAKDVPMLSNRFMNASWPTILPIGIANGALIIQVVNKLMAPASTANTKVFIFARAKANMQFAVPKTYEIIENTAGTGLTVMEMDQAYYLQGGALGDEVAERERIVLVPESGDYPVAEICAGETVRSVRALMQKFSQVRSLSPVIPATGAQAGVYVAHFGWIPTVAAGFINQSVPNMSGNTHEFSWFGWYMPLFVGIAGSTRYKIMNTEFSEPTQTAVFGATAWPLHSGLAWTPSSQTIVSTTAQLWPTKAGEAYEGTVPYYFNREFCCAYNNPRVDDIGVNTEQTRVDFLVCMSQTAEYSDNVVYGVLYRAAGPDLRLIRFRYVPKVFSDYRTINKPLYGAEAVV
jgi:hypothetical protein